MKTESNLTRRETLLTVLKSAVAASLAVPALANEEEPRGLPEPEFVLENDYPCFGYEPESLS